jgi:hypothetical protein
MLLEKKEVFVGLNGVKIGKENGMRAGLYNSPSPAPQQRPRKEFGRRSPGRRRPTYLSLLLIAGPFIHLLLTSSYQNQKQACIS